jgi:hypothetical protein
VGNDAISAQWKFNQFDNWLVKRVSCEFPHKILTILWSYHAEEELPLSVLPLFALGPLIGRQQAQFRALFSILRVVRHPISKQYAAPSNTV